MTPIGESATERSSRLARHSDARSVAPIAGREPYSFSTTGLVVFKVLPLLIETAQCGFADGCHRAHGLHGNLAANTAGRRGAGVRRVE